MQRVLVGLAALAAVMFLLISGTANSLFLSSLGRTGLEVALLAALSIASDLAKAILPVVVTRAILQGWQASFSPRPSRCRWSPGLASRRQPGAFHRLRAMAAPSN